MRRLLLSDVCLKYKEPLLQKLNIILSGKPGLTDQPVHINFVTIQKWPVLQQSGGHHTSQVSQSRWQYTLVSFTFWLAKAVGFFNRNQISWLCKLFTRRCLGWKLCTCCAMSCYFINQPVITRRLWVQIDLRPSAHFPCNFRGATINLADSKYIYAPP